ncbi:MAG: hypothetical protein KF684_09510 [Phycisphaeraceae bacterium]|nr:hypothetical protein [Phycisphaeraceae bacterium]
MPLGSDPPKPATRSQLAEADPELAIGLSLTGAMPCITCGYDLQGLSVIGVCPECGSAVRATILAKVDPQADELQPLLHPGLAAYGLAGGVIAGFIATITAWLPRVAEAAERYTPLDTARFFESRFFALAIFLCVSVAAFAPLTIVRPVSKTTRAQMLITLAAFPLFAPMLWAVHRIYFVIDPVTPPAYFVGSPDPDRLVARFVFTGALIGALLCVRPAARRLARRSMAMRAGRLNRQTVFAMAGALLVASVGDVLRVVAVGSPPALRDGLDIAGSLLVFGGSAMFTVGAAFCAYDAVRVAQALRRPQPGLRQVVGSASRPSTPARR